MLQSLIKAASQSPFLVCAHFSDQREDQNSSRASNRHSHRPIHHLLAPSTPGTRTPCGQTTAWPRSATWPSYPLAAMPFYCPWCLLTISAANQNILSPAGGEKHQNIEEEEKNIPPVCCEGRKKIGCGTYIIRLLFGLHREVLLVYDE